MDRNRNKTWILVADAGRARVLAQRTRSSDLVLVDGMDLTHPNPKSSVMGSDSLPRTFDSVGPGRHAIEPRSDPHRAEKRNFAKELSGLLDDGLAAAAYDQVFIIAPPRMMGDLHEFLSDKVKHAVVGELLLDLAHAPIGEIARRLAEARAA